MRQWIREYINPRYAWPMWAVMLSAFVAFMGICVYDSVAKADHDGDDQPWRRPLLDACAATWDYTSTRVTVDAPGHPQHGRSLHDQPWEVRDIFYRTWFRDTEDERAVDAHLIQWRREYECTHPKGVVLTPVPALVTVGGLPRGGGGPVFVHTGPSPPPGYPSPTPTPEPLISPSASPTASPTPEPETTVTRTPTKRSTANVWKWHCHQREGRDGKHGVSWYGYVVACADLITQPCDDSPLDITCDYGRHHRHLHFTHGNQHRHCHGC